MNSSSYIDQKNCLLQILTCIICSQRASQAHVCPNCSKFFCFNCIVKKIQQNNHKCPYCSKQLKQQQLINSQKLCMQLTTILESMELRQKKQQNLDKYLKDNQNDKNICYKHKSKQISKLYCQNCQKVTCQICHLSSSKNKGHSLVNVQIAKQKYIESVNQLKSRIQQAKNKLQQQLQSQKKYSPKDDCDKSLKKLDNFAKNLEQKIHKDFNNDMKQFDKIILRQQQSIKQMNQFYQKYLNTLNEYNQADFLLTGYEQMQIKLKNTTEQLKNQTQQLSQQVNRIKLKQFQSQILPKYQSKQIKISNYSQICKKGQMFYTQIYKMYNLSWRLKIYPYGNQQQKLGIQQQHKNINKKQIYKNKDKYMSIFIQLQKGLRKIGNYRHKIILHNFNDMNKDIQRQFQSEFQQGQCWGYDKFIKVDHLFQMAYINQQEDSLNIKLMIAPSSYYQAKMDLLVIKQNKEKIQLENKQKRKQILDKQVAKQQQ